MTSSSIEIFNGENVSSKSILSFDEALTNSNTLSNMNAYIKLYELLISINSSNEIKSYSSIFEYILTQTMNITNSEIGGICELVRESSSDDKKLNTSGSNILLKDEYLKFITISAAVHPLEGRKDSKKFHSTELNNLLGRAVNGNTIVISNNVSSDPRSKGLPENHFKLHRFMGIPLTTSTGVIGQIVLANKTAEYAESDIYSIYLFIKLCTETLFNFHNKKVYSIDDILQTKSEVKKTKDDFLATMSHEIRTPLTGIMGAINLMPQAGPLNEKQQKHLKIATTCSVQLLDLINGILDFSRLTSNTLTLAREPFSIKECIDSAITIVKAKADMKNLELKVSVSDDIPNSVVGDSKRLKQILINILSNAIKFTDAGYIHFSCIAKKHKSEDEFFWKIKFIVTDTGIGIDVDDYSKIFKAFSQLPGVNAYSKQDGVGLGLAISKQLVELMGGKIKAHSDGLHKGATFEFYINIEENVNVDELLEKYHKHMSDITILNVDDKMENLLILDEILYRWHINSIMCSSAEQALRYLEKGKKFDIVILDIFMPHMSGIELAQRLREKYPHIPLIGISSVGDVPQGKEWFDVYLNKPYNPPKILKGIIKCLTSSLSVKLSRHGLADVHKPTKDTLKIIIAEDDASAQFMISEMITTLGYNQENVKIVNNGKECVDEIKNKIHSSRYDVCLMDIKMPILDGLEASKYIKTLENRPAIIAISAGVLDSDKNNCFQAGMDGYLGKPFSTKELDTVLKRFIE